MDESRWDYLLHKWMNPLEKKSMTMDEMDEIMNAVLIQLNYDLICAKDILERLKKKGIGLSG